MPKRTNRFQQIVAYIAEQLAPLGAKVRECVELAEEGDGTLREVDVLIEIDAGVTRVRIAVEARERSRKDNVEWIDSLIGKYASLKIDQILAVSSRGFTKAAKEKAAAHNIELLSPEAILATDLPAKFQRLGVASLKGEFDLVHVEFHSSPRITGSVGLDDRVERRDASGGREEGTVRGLIEATRSVAIPRVRQHVNENFLAIFKTLADLSEPKSFDGSFSTPGLFLVTGGTEYAVDRLSYRVVMRGERTVVPVAHQTLGSETLLSSSQLDETELVIAQTANAPRGKAFIRRAEKAKRPTRGRTRRGSRGPRQRAT